MAKKKAKLKKKKESKPDVISRVLTKIYNKHGEVTPPLVVAEASSPSSPIHNRFEWNDEKAAYEHRLAQARQIIRYYPVFVGKDGVEQLVNVTLETSDGPEGKYLPISVVVANQTLFDSAKNNLMRLFESLDRAIKELDEAARLAGNVKRAAKAKRLSKKISAISTEVTQL